jgi:hypothetical protein
LELDMTNDNRHESDKSLRQHVRRLEQQNDRLQYQNDLLHDAIETICAASPLAAEDEPRSRERIAAEMIAHNQGQSVVALSHVRRFDAEVDLRRSQVQHDAFGANASKRPRSIDASYVASVTKCPDGQRTSIDSVGGGITVTGTNVGDAGRAERSLSRRQSSLRQQ